jgi:hypothetical protein
VCKKDTLKEKAVVKLHLAFQFENTDTAFQEHMHLIKNVVLHEISQVSRFCLNWSVETIIPILIATFIRGL